MTMRAAIMAISHVLPEERMTSARIEELLAEPMSRLGYPKGIITGLTGIKQRRLWPRDTMPSDAATMAARKLQKDWREKYNYTPLLIESFVQNNKFEGTCYKAANWICAGTTKGRGKLDRNHLNAIPKKSIRLYPLCKNFKEQLCC